jgi:hypothetical protein
VVAPAAHRRIPPNSVLDRRRTGPPQGHSDCYSTVARLMWSTHRYLLLFLTCLAVMARAQAMTVDWTTIASVQSSLSRDLSKAHPHFHVMWISGARLVAVPEINPAWSAVASCLLVAALILRHSAKFRK